MCLMYEHYVDLSHGMSKLFSTSNVADDEADDDDDDDEIGRSCDATKSGGGRSLARRARR